MNTEFLISTRRALSALLRLPPNALMNGMLITLAFALIRMAVKRTWICNTADDRPWHVRHRRPVDRAAVLDEPRLRRRRVGALHRRAGAVRYAPAHPGSPHEQHRVSSGLTTDFEKLYAPGAIWVMALVAATAAFGYYASRTGEPLFGKFES